METAYLILGSNSGDSRQLLHTAIEELKTTVGKIDRLSSVYETEPWGNKEQPSFLNQALSIVTQLSPEALLKAVLEIEQKHGRVRNEKWAPRTLDIDILYYGKEIITKKELKIPHPEIQSRNFVLIPLTEIAGEFIHPVFNITNNEMLRRCTDELKASKVD